MTSGSMLEAILADPLDDAPRLVLADVLQQEGDPRGELIAIQCELARLGCSRRERIYLDWIEDALADESAIADHRLSRLRRREGVLLKKHGLAWASEVAPRASAAKLVRFWRGFVDHTPWNVRATAPFTELAARAPVTSVMPTDVASAAELAAFLTLPALARIDELYISTVEGGLLPFAADTLGRLRRLSLAHAGGPYDLTAAPRSGIVERLEGLVLNGFALGAPGVAPLLSGATRLRELQLVDTRLGGAAVAELATMPCIDTLRILGIRHGRLEPSDLMPILSHGRIGEHLEALDLRTNRIGVADAAVLGNGFPALRILDLGNNPLALAMRRLVGGGGLPRLRVLGMHKSSVDDAALATLAGSPLMSRLQVLDLRQNGITDAGVAHLAKANVPALRTLFLGGNDLTAAGKKRLKESRSLANVRLHL